MNMEELIEKIDKVKKLKNYLELRVQDISRVDLIKVHYRKTEDIVGNHGVVEATNAYEVYLDLDQNKGIYEQMKEFYYQKLNEELATVTADLERLEEKKNKIEEYMNSII